MTHYDVDYSTVADDEKDAKAVKDIQEYLNEKQWKALMEAVEHPSNYDCNALSFLLSFCGVRGFPVFAFLRTYRAADYQAWYDSLED